jgi:phytoene dehydrogenase-like protein
MFVEERTRALFGGIAAHGMLPLDRALTAGFGLVLGTMAHLVGWVFPRGGAQKLTDALVAHLEALGGEVIVNQRIASIDDLPKARAVLCDLSPRPFLRVAGRRLPARYRQSLERYRYGMGVYKVDWALDGPIPWRAAGCRRAATVHVCGTLAELARSEHDTWRGVVSDRPFVLLVQPTLFDASRAPAGKHTAWAYCHVPAGSTVDMLPRIEAQIERFAPGFSERVLARSVMTPADIEAHNANLVAVTSAPASSTCVSSSRDRPGGLTPPRRVVCTSVPLPRHQVSACTACVAISPRSVRWPTLVPDASYFSALSTDGDEVTMISAGHVAFCRQKDLVRIRIDS